MKKKLSLQAKLGLIVLVASLFMFGLVYMVNKDDDSTKKDPVAVNNNNNNTTPSPSAAVTPTPIPEKTKEDIAFEKEENLNRFQKSDFPKVEALIKDYLNDSTTKSFKELSSYYPESYRADYISAEYFLFDTRKTDMKYKVTDIVVKDKGIANTETDDFWFCEDYTVTFNIEVTMADGTVDKQKCNDVITATKHNGKFYIFLIDHKQQPI